MSNLDILKEGIADIKAREDTKLAEKTILFLDFLLKDETEKGNWSLYTKYKEDLFLYTFRYLQEEEQLDFFAKEIHHLLNTEDINFIIDSVKYFLYSYWRMEEYKTMREKLLQNLYENKELLTKTKVLYKNGKEVDGIIKNWFKNYQIQFDHNKEFRIGMMEYLNKSVALKALKKNEKEAVKNLIYLIEYLRADAEENLKKEDSYILKFGEGDFLMITDGKVSEMNGQTDSKEKDFIQALSDSYDSVFSVKKAEKKEKSEVAIAEQKKAISDNQKITSLKEKVQLSEEEMINFRNIIAKYKALPDDEIIDYFWEGLDSYNKYLIMGALQELIRRKQWEEIWDIPRLRLLLNDYRSRNLKDLSIDPDNKKMNLKVLLLFLLEKHLSLPVDNSKKWALYLVNWLMKNGYENYKDLIYFDQEKGHLAWEKS